MSLDVQNDPVTTISDAPSQEHMLVSPAALSRWLNSSTKRFFDLAIAGPLLVASSPLMAFIALGVRLTSPGPAVFRQERVGKGHQPFTIYKFRTMVVDEGGAGVTARHDSRLTGFGRVLRRLKLDELPQLYNVVRGDMSLVGPRPKLMAHERMNVVCRPGITGMATLAFAREEDILVGIHEKEVEQYMIDVLNPIKARLDVNYVENGTFLMDLQILTSTVFRIGRRRIMDEVPKITEDIFNKTMLEESQRFKNASKPQPARLPARRTSGRSILDSEPV